MMCRISLDTHMPKVVIKAAGLENVGHEVEKAL